MARATMTFDCEDAQILTNLLNSAIALTANDARLAAGRGDFAILGEMAQHGLNLHSLLARVDAAHPCTTGWTDRAPAMLASLSA